MYKSISSNVRFTWVLLLIFAIFVIGLGYVFSLVFNSDLILVLAVLIAFGQAFVSYYYSDKIALFAAHARETKRSEYLELHRIVENISITAGQPQPKIYVIDDPSPNAFATGRDPKYSSLAVTTGLLKKLNKTELEGVISHELSHIGNYDIRLMSLVVVLVGVIALISDWFLRYSIWGSRDSDNRDSGWLFLVGIILAILAPLSVTLIQLAISRRREYLADATGALITRYPEGLASALEKISNDSSNTVLRNRATAHLFISDPFRSDKKTPPSGGESWFQVVFSTHPPIRERVKRLREMIH